MIHTLLNVVYVLIAIAMIVLILLQRGAGAQAGSGFGAGASGTVFGSRGSANFLSSTTKWLAGLFFALSLFMAWQASHESRATTPDKVDLGVIDELPAAGAPKGTALPAAPVQSLPAPAPAGSAPLVPPPVLAPAPSAAPASADPAASKAAPAGKEGG
jgi:preprotein translocase subunit SecG